MTTDHPVATHYTRGDLAVKILDALAKDGRDLDSLTIDDLAPYDEFHIRGREATIELAGWAGLTAQDRVLDVGSGIGGPSRYLAATFGCSIVGVDLTSEFCDAATMFAERVGLAERVSYQQGDALAMPFDDASFDIAWSQHAAMNIADKPALYREIHRVLKPGGRLALYDIGKGPGEDVIYPVPWAGEPSISFLIPPIELRDVLEEIGFQINYFHDATREAATPRDTGEEDDSPPTPPGVRLAMGEDWQAKISNLRKNLEDRRVAVVQAVAKRR